MENYADYSYYKDKYKGLLDEPSFSEYSTRASLEIRKKTQNRATSDIEDVKLCMCELVDKMKENSKYKTTISSEKNDKYSVNYVTKTDVDKSKEYNNIIKQYLGMYGLLGGAVIAY